VAHLRRGLARPAASVIPPSSWAYDPDLSFPHDPARAGALLDAAGYPDPDGEGPAPRQRATLKTSTAESARLQAVVLQGQLRHVGVDVEVRSLEFAALSTEIARGSFQMFAVARPEIEGVRLSLTADFSFLKDVYRVGGRGQTSDASR
jgi:peptide/nickel transport system substrate-binding protein